MVGITPPSITSKQWSASKWDSLSFASTLYLHPIIDTLLDSVSHRAPYPVCYELRLGLQEALVNAAKHGNQLNPAKQVSVDYSRCGRNYWWIVRDQGMGFDFPKSCGLPVCDAGTDFTEECGRGLFILYQIFDEVVWDQDVRALHLRKHIGRSRWPWLLRKDGLRASRLWPISWGLQQGA